MRLNLEPSRFKLFFWCFVLFYTALILYKPELGPADEYAFLPTLQSGKHFPMYDEDFPYYDHKPMGRFCPLGGQEYNIVAFFSNSPQAYFIFNALAFVIFTLVFLSILNRFSSNKTLNYAITLLLFFLPGFTITFFKILFSEKSVLLYFTLFLISFIKFHETKKILYALCALVFANLVIYYKETAFLVIAVFSFGHLWFSWKQTARQIKILDALLLLSAFVFIALYVIMIVPHRQIVTGTTIYNPMLVFAKNLLNYGLFSDPVLIFVGIPLLLWRLYKVFIKRHEPHAILDPMLAAGFTYITAYFALNMYSPYYLLPAYVFVLPPALYFLTRGQSNLFWKSTFAISGLALLVNTIPLGIHYLTYNKYVPTNFNKAMDFLVQDINSKYAGERLDVFFDGVDRGTGRGIYFVAGEFLKFKGLSIRKFDFKSSIEAVDSTPFQGKGSPFDKIEDVKAVDPTGNYKYPRFPFTVFQPGPLPEIQTGDYLVLAPQSVKGYDRTYVENLRKDYDLVFYTESPFAFPSVHLKMAAKYFLSRKLSAEQKTQGLMVNENFWNWPDYYVFIKK